MSLLKTGLGVETWHCQDQQSGGEILLKWASTTTPSAWLRVEHESRLLRQLDSPYVRPVSDWGREPDGCWCASPYLGGESLRQRLQRAHPSLQETLDWAVALLQGLRAVHRLGLIHRDLKPENVILTRDGPVLIDFGLARTPGAGTWSYLAPEQTGLLAYDVGQHSDLYALGLLLWECLDHGIHRAGEGLRTHLLPRARLPHVPRAVDDLIARLSQPDPRRRYRQADRVLADLEKIRVALQHEEDPLIVLGLNDQRENLAEPGFVDREVERAFLLDQLTRLAQGEDCPSVWLVASSGGGKSRLLDEVALEASRRGLRVLRGGAEPDRTPFSALEGPVVEAAEDPAWHEHITAGLGSWREVLAPLYPVLGTSGPAPGPETFGEERVRLALGAWLQALGRAEHPVVLLVDDAQWADPPIANALSQGPYRNLLVVAASRVVPSTQPGHVLELAALEERHVGELTASMAGNLPAPVRKSILQSTDGNPLLVVEMLRGLVESGGLEFQEQGWSWRPEVTQQLSHRGAALLERRLETLSPAAASALEVAAVLGRAFSQDLLQEMTGESTDALAEGRARHLLWFQGDRVQFSHDRLRECLLERLPLQRRQELHTRAATLLALRPPRPSREIATHLGAAGLYREALPDALKAAGDARARFALPASEEMYRLATRGALSASERRESWEGLGVVLDLQGVYAESRQALGLALQSAGSRLERSDIFGRLGLVAQHDSANGEGAGWFTKALAELDQQIPARTSDLPRALRQLVRLSGERDKAARLLAEATHCFFMDGNFLAGIYCQLLSYRLAGRATSINFAVAALVAGNLGWRRAARYFANQALERARHDDGYTRGRTAARCAAALTVAGYLDEAFKTGGLAHHHLKISGDKWELESYKAFSAWRLEARGRLEEVTEMFTKPCHDPLNEVARRWALCRIGHHPPPVDAAEDTDPGPLVKAQQLGVQGRSFLAQGRLELAVETLRKSLRIPMSIFQFERMSLRLAFVEALREYAASMPHGAERLDLLRQARSQARRISARAGSYPLCGPPALRERALLAAEKGQPHLANRLAAQALQEATRLGMPLEVERAKALQLRLDNPTARPPAPSDLTLAQDDRLAQVLATGARLALLRERSQLVDAILEAGLSLLRAEQVVWIEHGQAVKALPPGRAVFSRALLDQALDEGFARLVERPESLSDSLLLSDIRSALCARVDSETGVEGVVYFLHRGVSSLFGTEDEQVAAYLATLSGAGFTNQARRQASEAAHREREEQEARLATLFRQAEAAMALVSSDGHLLEANRNWEENLGPIPPLRAVLPTDRDRLDLGQTVRYARRDGGVGLALPAHQRLDDGSVLNTFSDVSLSRVPELLEFFEQERQWLAAELHDGPSQTLAHACLEGPDPALRGAMEELLGLMHWLASPSLDGVAFTDALARLHVDIVCTTEPEVTEGTALYRILQELLEGCSEDASLQLAPGQLTIGCSEFAPDPEIRRRVELRCKVTGLRIDWLSNGARVAWSRSADL